ncbi:MAG: NAD-dependent epimerase/dehydratase family protein [Anaerolineae bacterium]|nr:NAD-dependent epimerase/dehydratase family protein [Anaerolineae bacterium]MCO5204105.1 NAD-dependent epimerase/dehydratase family protein [Anaerolineae bacterium]
MNLLILGGTVFLGRHITEAAVAAGHTVTLFNRGQSGADIFPQLETLIGDRDKGDLSALDGRTWDAVIDTCAYVPRVARDSATKLADTVAHYTFVSTCSVYANLTTTGQDETAPVIELEDPTVENVTGETYGGLKVLCERAVAETLPDRTLIIRPGLIVGPHDRSDRFTYWPVRVADGGEVLAPGRPERPVQYIDVRDLAAWTVRMVEQKATGVYNTIGPEPETTMGATLESCRRISGSNAAFTWVDEAFLLENEVGAYVEMPLWVPEEYRAFDAFSADKAVAAGLTYRPIDDTIRATLTWQATRPADYQWRAGLTRERERELLTKWHQQPSSLR